MGYRKVASYVQKDGTIKKVNRYNPEIIYGASRMAEYLSVSTGTIKKWIKELDMPCHTIEGEYSGAKTFFFLEEIRDWIRIREQVSNDQKNRIRKKQEKGAALVNYYIDKKKIKFKEAEGFDEIAVEPDQYNPYN